MKGKTLIVGLLSLVVIIILGFLLFDFVLGPTQYASPNMTAIPIEQSASTLAPTETPSESSAIPQELATEPALQSPQAVGEKIFLISQSESQASFTIYEELNGQPKDVIGVTNLVAGELAIDPEDLTTAKVGTIQINARDLTTDSDRRNQAIRNRILETDAYEFITFNPMTINGLSGSGKPGDTYTFQITGELTIREVTKPITFDMVVSAETASRVAGTATATIKLTDFELVVPNVPFVANVADELKLEFKFVAVAE